MKIAEEAFTRMFGWENDPLPASFLAQLDRADVGYRPADGGERDAYLAEMTALIESEHIRRNVEENHAAWERGWGEIAARVAAGPVTLEQLKPQYFRPSRLLRYDRSLIVADNPQIEWDLFLLARHLIFHRYLVEADTIYELGCGTCQNLLVIAELFADKQLFGLDWSAASARIASRLTATVGDRITGRQFDMFRPPDDLQLVEGAAVMTIHAMEQIGARHEKLLGFLLSQRPSIVVHYEPILELYETDDPLDRVALEYCEKRNYLTGFLTALRQLEGDGRVEIIDVRRPALGGVRHEASLVVWRPI